MVNKEITKQIIRNVKAVPAETPAGASFYWGVVGYIAPAAPPGLENKSANMAVKMVAAGVNMIIRSCSETED